MKKALLIRFDGETGVRPGGINPRVNQGLLCPPGWQNLDVEPAVEIRMVDDGVDVSQYEGVEGITVLEGEAAINKAVKANIVLTHYIITDEALMLAHVLEKGLSLDDLVGKSGPEAAKWAYDAELAGVTKREIKLLEKG